MITYLLLRNNKESGPHSLEELAGMNLKAYDLVWVNGKSAAWRYPGEIAELKAFAPAVEEQPYDRFFKKPSESPREETYQPKVEERYIPKAEEKYIPPPQPSFIPKKSVFVTLPGQKSFVPKVETPEPVKKQEPVVIAETISITENPETAKIKYSQPLDEIKEMYVKTLHDRKQKIANKAFLIQAFKKVAVVAVIIGAGVLIGFTIKSGPSEKIADNSTIAGQQKLAVAQQPEADPSDQPLLEKQQPGEPETSQSLSAEKIESEPLFTEPDKPAVVEKQKTEIIPNVIAPKKEMVKPGRKEITIDEPSPGVDVNARTGERSRKLRTVDEDYSQSEIETVKQPSANEPKAVMKKSSELSKLVSVKSNDYHIVAFGGIRNLQLTVYNDSKFILDNVIVELQYLKPSEQPLKTEHIEFRSVAPNGTMTIKVPDTNRGIKVTYRITNILSTQSAKEMAGL
ncbi:MAG TPA: hypothetical protein VF476_06170 [Chitinophagaceae bacterium]